jgi:molybdenum cofactor biosynthesis enzyme MoaA
MNANDTLIFRKLIIFRQIVINQTNLVHVPFMAHIASNFEIEISLIGYMRRSPMGLEEKQTF